MVISLLFCSSIFPKFNFPSHSWTELLNALVSTRLVVSVTLVKGLFYGQLLVLGIFAYCPFHTFKKCFERCEEWFDCQGGPAVWGARSAEGRTGSNKAGQSQNRNQSQGAGGGAKEVSDYPPAPRNWEWIVVNPPPLFVLLCFTHGISIGIQRHLRGHNMAGLGFWSSSSEPRLPGVKH